MTTTYISLRTVPLTKFVLCSGCLLIVFVCFVLVVVFTFTLNVVAADVVTVVVLLIF